MLELTRKKKSAGIYKFILDTEAKKISNVTLAVSWIILHM